ncbi:MAG: RNA polymerase sigma-70 factor [Balneolaceae bacterium]
MDRNTTNNPGSRIPEPQIIEEIRLGNKKAFEQLFFEYYYSLCRFGVRYANSSELSRDAVQDVFLKIWNGRETWQIQSSLKAYLYRAVRNQAINLREQQEVWNVLPEEPESPFTFTEELTASEADENSGKLFSQIWDLVEKMPTQRKLVFELHRQHGLTYKEISEVMRIAPKTVENHMSRALQELRNKLHVDTG